MVFAEGLPVGQVCLLCLLKFSEAVASFLVRTLAPTRLEPNPVADLLLLQIFPFVNEASQQMLPLPWTSADYDI